MTEPYYISNKIRQVWNNLKDGKLAEYDEDRVYIVDGREGCGKSLFTIQQAAFIDPTILDNGPNGELIPRICFSVESFAHALRNTKSTKTHTKVVIFDEGFRGFSSKASISRTNKELIQLLMEVRQNNLIIFIVSPNYFLLDWYLAVHRSHGLFHVKKDQHSTRRSFRAFNYKQKNVLYDLGKRKGGAFYKSKSAIRDRFSGIWPGGKDFEARYRQKKQESFTNSAEDESDNKMTAERRIILLAWFDYMQSQFKFTREDFLKLLFERTGIRMSPTNLSHLREKARKSGQLVRNEGENIIIKGLSGAENDEY